MFYECRFCHKLYKQESAFAKHYCEERRKNDVAKTIIGQIAFSLYDRWLHKKYKREADLDMFKQSRFFNAFVKFADLYKKINGLADVDEFFALMIRKNIQPSNWVDDRIIRYYLDHIDSGTIQSKITRSCNTLIKIADAYDCDTSEVFNHIEFFIMMDFIKLRKLSPWVLLNSKAFMKWLSTISKEQQQIIDNLIDPDKWVKIFSENRKYISLSRSICTELGI